MNQSTLHNRIWKWYALIYDKALCYAPAYLALIDLIVKSILTHTNKQQLVHPHILELGCGTGNIIQACQSQLVGAITLGVDFTPSMIKQAKRKMPTSQWQLADLTQFLKQSPSQSYDIIIMNNSLYSISNKDQLIGEIYRVCKNKGLYIVSDPDKKTANLLTFFKYHIRSASLLQLGMLPFLFLSGLFSGYFVYHKQYTRSCSQEVANLAIKNKFSILEQHPTYGHMNFFLVCFKSASS